MLMSLCTDAQMKPNDVKVRKRKESLDKMSSIMKTVWLLEIWFDLPAKRLDCFDLFV